MPARADFECKKCEATIPDLPADSICCPRCGRKQGFRRLYNKVQVSTRGHRAARFIDKRMRPAMDEHTSRKQSAQKFEDAIVEVKDRIWEKATPEQRAVIAENDPKGSGTQALRNVGAAAAFSTLDPGAKHSSAANFDGLRRQVRPQWRQ